MRWFTSIGKFLVALIPHDNVSNWPLVYWFVVEFIGIIYICCGIKLIDTWCRIWEEWVSILWHHGFIVSGCHVWKEWVSVKSNHVRSGMIVVDWTTMVNANIDGVWVVDRWVGLGWVQDLIADLYCLFLKISTSNLLSHLLFETPFFVKLFYPAQNQCVCF